MASIPLIDATVPEDLLITSILDSISTEMEFKWEMILIGLQVFVLGKWYFLLPMAMFVAVMMVTNLPMFSLKLKSLKYKEHTLVFNFLIFTVLMLILLKWLAVPILIFAYIIVSFIKWLGNRNKVEK
jgi:phosphatidylserine synthase